MHVLMHVLMLPCDVFASPSPNRTDTVQCHLCAGGISCIDKGSVHDVAEYNVCVLLQGDIDTSYTQADNSVVVPTDTVKNTTYRASPSTISSNLS
jgi:urate oxidase